MLRVSQKSRIIRYLTLSTEYPCFKYTFPWNTRHYTCLSALRCSALLCSLSLCWCFKFMFTTIAAPITCYSVQWHSTCRQCFGLAHQSCADTVLNLWILMSSWFFSEEEWGIKRARATNTTANVSAPDSAHAQTAFIRDVAVVFKFLSEFKRLRESELASGLFEVEFDSGKRYKKGGERERNPINT